MLGPYKSGSRCSPFALYVGTTHTAQQIQHKQTSVNTHTLTHVHHTRFEWAPTHRKVIPSFECLYLLIICRALTTEWVPLLKIHECLCCITNTYSHPNIQAMPNEWSFFLFKNTNKHTLAHLTRLFYRILSESIVASQFPLFLSLIRSLSLSFEIRILFAQSWILLISALLCLFR